MAEAADTGPGALTVVVAFENIEVCFLHALIIRIIGKVVTHIVNVAGVVNGE